MIDFDRESKDRAHRYIMDVMVTGHRTSIDMEIDMAFWARSIAARVEEETIQRCQNVQRDRKSVSLIERLYSIPNPQDSKEEKE